LPSINHQKFDPDNRNISDFELSVTNNYPTFIEGIFDLRNFLDNFIFEKMSLWY